ncbi:MAG TPA: phosphatase PAP2 family protein [Thermoleophilaceae bacterium]|nr:phosphatase PAP2 family protein [Thermoleophilaceae bacterium]
MSDYHLFRWANDLAARHDGFEDGLKVYAQISEILFALSLVALFLFFGPRLRRAAVAAGLSAGLALLVAHFLAAAVDRSRPFVDHPLAHNFLSHATDPGFPSDHATGAFAVAFALVLRDRVVGGIALVFALILSFGRVALGAHYPSDVFAGAILGLAGALVLWIPALRERVDRLADALGNRLPVTTSAVRRSS